MLNIIQMLSTVKLFCNLHFVGSTGEESLQKYRNSGIKLQKLHNLLRKYDLYFEKVKSKSWSYFCDRNKHIRRYCAATGRGDNLFTVGLSLAICRYSVNKYSINLSCMCLTLATKVGLV